MKIIKLLRPIILLTPDNNMYSDSTYAFRHNAHIITAQLVHPFVNLHL